MLPKRVLLTVFLFAVSIAANAQPPEISRETLSEYVDHIQFELDSLSGLESEIRGVIRSDEWAHYVEGEHYRELTFLHFAEPRSWRVGAFDLYRPGEPDEVIDFKTHEIDAEDAARVSKDHDIQARIYREAAAVRGPARVLLHFTGPNTVVEMTDGDET